ncbi:MAG: DUF433 domain-containing protein [Thermomicrobiales bacterium]
MIKELQINFFSPRQVARVTGISLDQLEEWLEDEVVVPIHPAASGDFAGAIYGMGDIVALLAIQHLQKAGVAAYWLAGVQHLLAEHVTLDELRQHQVCFAANRIHIIRSDADNTDASFESADPVCVALEPLVSRALEGVERLSERLPEQIGQIVSDPYIWEGVPIIAGTRIPTFTMTDLVRSGWTIQRILWEYPRLTKEDVEAALRFDADYSAVARRRAS